MKLLTAKVCFARLLDFSSLLHVAEMSSTVPKFHINKCVVRARDLKFQLSSASDASLSPDDDDDDMVLTLTGELGKRA